MEAPAMRKSKRGAELFEVLQKAPRAEKPFEVPRWWSSRAGRSGRAEAVASDVKGEREEVAASRRDGSHETLAAATDDVPPSAGSGRTFELAGSRLRISLTSFSAAIIIATGLMVLAVSFRIGQDRGFRAGRASYESAAWDVIQKTRLEPPNRELLAGLQQPESGAEDPGPPRSSARFMIETDVARDSGPVWVRGHTYVNVQDFASGSGDDAERIQAFLAEHGVETAIIPLEGGWRRLLTTQGYNHDDSVQKGRNQALLERVRSLGVLYQKGGGRYDWQSAFFRKLEKDSW
jgi:hypothetical protein